MDESFKSKWCDAQVVYEIELRGGPCAGETLLFGYLPPEVRVPAPRSHMPEYFASDEAILRHLPLSVLRYERTRDFGHNGRPIYRFVGYEP